MSNIRCILLESAETIVLELSLSDVQNFVVGNVTTPSIGSYIGTSTDDGRQLIEKILECLNSSNKWQSVKAICSNVVYRDMKGNEDGHAICLFCRYVTTVLAL